MGGTVGYLETTSCTHYRITSLEELERLSRQSPLCDWGELLKRDPKNTFFQGPIWTREWYYAYGDAFDPLVIVVTRGAELVGVIPLAVEKRTRRLAFAGDQMADYRDIVAHPNARVEVTRALLRVYREGNFRNMLRVGPMLPESDTARIMLSMVREEGVWGISRSHFGWRWWPEQATEDFLKKRSVHYKLNRYRRRGEINAEVLTSPGEWNGLKEEFYNQHSLRQLYGGRGISFDNSMKRAFFERLFETNLAHFTVLRVADKVIAGHYGCVWNGVLYWGAPAFDIREWAYSPGLLLLLLTMKRHAEWGFRGVDLTIGEGSLKENFSTSRVDLPSVDLYSRRSAWGKQRILDILVRGARGIACRAGGEKVWDSRVRPTLMQIGDALRTAARIGFLRGFQWLCGLIVQSAWHSTKTSLFSLDPRFSKDAPLFIEPAAPGSPAHSEIRKNNVYDLLRWTGSDPLIAARLTGVARKLPEAARAGRSFHTLLIDGRLAAWGFSSRTEATQDAPFRVELRDFEALQEDAGPGGLETLLYWVTAEWLEQGADQVQLQATDAPSAALAAFRRAGFLLVETKIDRNRLGRRSEKTVKPGPRQRPIQ